LIGDTCLLTVLTADLVIVECVLMLQMAVGKGVQIMSVEWVEKCWELRDDPVTSATDEHLVTCSNCILIFQLLLLCKQLDRGLGHHTSPETTILNCGYFCFCICCD